jgi:hypothetical protein
MFVGQILYIASVGSVVVYFVSDMFLSAKYSMLQYLLSPKCLSVKCGESPVSVIISLVSNMFVCQIW